MRAVVMTKYGGPEVMELRDVPEPPMAARDVLVEVRAASLNPVDFKIREGQLKAVLKYRLPLTMGNDLSGVVKEAGRSNNRFKPGDKVYARVNKNRIGTFAEYIAVDRADVAPMPPSLSFEEAASLPLVGLTVWQCLKEIMSIKEGQSILIHAGAGGVGTFAIQLAKHIGARVITTASEKNHEFLTELGADEVIDYRNENFVDKLSDLDYVLDTMGGHVLRESFKVVKRGGKVVSITSLPDDKAAVEMGINLVMRMGLKFMNRKVNACAKQAGAEYRFHFMRSSEAQLRQIGDLVESGDIKPVIDSVYPLEDFKAAMAKLEEGHARGKIVLKMRD